MSLRGIRPRQAEQAASHDGGQRQEQPVAVRAHEGQQPVVSFSELLLGEQSPETIWQDQRFPGQIQAAAPLQMFKTFLRSV
jgi:hypothetical protein